MRRILPSFAVLSIMGLATSGLVACQSTEPPPYDGQNLFLGMREHLASTLPDLRTLAARNDGVFPRERMVEMIDGRSFRSVHGSADMPVWGFQFRREEGMTSEGLRNVEARIDALVDHIQSLQQERRGYPAIQPRDADPDRSKA